MLQLTNTLGPTMNRALPLMLLLGCGDKSTDSGEDDADHDGYLASVDDCDDEDAAVHPGADEYCNNDDDDCDGTIDEDAVDATTWAMDADLDGYGDADAPLSRCNGLTGAVENAEDCDDSRADIYPGAPEDLCIEAVDQDCDGIASPEDADGDGLDACEDCDDTNAFITTPSTWFLDQDGDGYGDPAVTTDACSAPSGYVADATDCDDGSNSISPGAPELCNGVDDDCDGDTDEDDATDAVSWYEDADGDGWGDDSTARTGCSALSGEVAAGGDCDDEDPTSSPDGTEICDEADNDCNGTVDDSATDASTWYQDGDSDSWGNSAVTLASCDQPGGYVAVDGDCDDAAALVSPSATESCENGSDDDCDGLADCEDGDCAGPICGELTCDDGLDDDSDGREDCLDDDCWGTVSCQGHLRTTINAGATGHTVYEYNAIMGGSFARPAIYGISGQFSARASVSGSWKGCTWSLDTLRGGFSNYTWVGSHSWTPSRDGFTIAGSCGTSGSAFLPDTFIASVGMFWFEKDVWTWNHSSLYSIRKSWYDPTVTDNGWSWETTYIVSHSGNMYTYGTSYFWRDSSFQTARTLYYP